jgi:membrane-bound metal-dependent hydrolase YbcI (DUF457 family)
MPRAKEHLIIGAVAAAATNALLQTLEGIGDPHHKFDWGELLTCAGIGGMVALIPDVLEPATTPNHRQIFHSVACAASVAYICTGKHTERWQRAERVFAVAIAAGYLSHLGADAMTPRSISLI